MSHSLIYFHHHQLKLQPFHIILPFSLTQFNNNTAFHFNPQNYATHCIVLTNAVVVVVYFCFIIDLTHLGESKKNHFDLWVSFLRVFEKCSLLWVIFMGSNSSKATSSSTSSSSRNFRKRSRSKALRGFRSYCLGTSSGSRDSDYEDQVCSLIFPMLLFFHMCSFFY